MGWLLVTFGSNGRSNQLVTLEMFLNSMPITNGLLVFYPDARVLTEARFYFFLLNLGFICFS